MPAPPALGAGPACGGDLLGCRRAVVHGIVDDLVGGPGAQADKIPIARQVAGSMLMRWANLPTNWVG
ncbi:hypothetical protein MAGR_01920 [Mycolicibacterium agri]|uniref:Uncharacterized protein n=1 Tax=Mycolicibacterium agri TaxID=36811 RepID=A0A7I9VTK3_MYCAG|nr:hypothetical protein MAGR_01920 [Mycolicibacterium agri]